MLFRSDAQVAAERERITAAIETAERDAPLAVKSAWLRAARIARGAP